MKPDYPDSHLNEILRDPPSKLITRSILSTLIGFAVLVAAGLIIKIPETATGPARLVSNLAFVEVYPAVEGNISHLFVEDGSYVKKDAPLAVIQNPVDDHEYLLIRQSLDGISKLMSGDDTLQIATFSLPAVTEIGMLQGAFQELRSALHNLAVFSQSAEYQRHKEILKGDLRIYRETAKQLKTRESLREESVELSKSQVERNEKLHSQGLIADAEMDRIKSEWVDKKMELEALRAQILQNQLAINRCLEATAENDFEYQKLLDAKFLAIREALEKNREQLQKWEETYLLRAPVDGKVQLARAWEPQQKVSPQQVAMTILPEKQQANTVKMFCTAQDAARVKTGQSVLLEMEGYPSFTYGYLEAEVRQVSEVPTDGRYAIEAELTDGFNTTLGKHLQFNRYAEGYGKIILREHTFVAQMLKNAGFLRNDYGNDTAE